MRNARTSHDGKRGLYRARTRVSQQFVFRRKLLTFFFPGTFRASYDPKRTTVRRDYNSTVCSSIQMSVLNGKNTDSYVSGCAVRGTFHCLRTKVFLDDVSKKVFKDIPPPPKENTVTRRTRRGCCAVNLAGLPQCLVSRGLTGFTRTNKRVVRRT